MTMTNELETKIRAALQAEVETIEVPDDLARRTIEAAKDADRSSWVRAATRRGPGGRRRVPRWAYAGAAAAIVTILFTVGALVGGVGGPSTMTASDPDATGEAADDLRVVEGGEGASTAQGLTSGLLSGGGGSSQAERPAASQDDPILEDFVRPPVVAQPGGEVPPKLVRTAEVTVEVPRGEFERARSEVHDVVESNEGFVTEFSTTEVTGDRLAEGTITARVPTEKLDAVLAELRDLGVLVRMDTSGTDVSGRLVDFDARIRNAEAQEVRLLGLLDEADDLSETLEIRSRLDEVREEIERLKAQRRSLQNQVDFSTVRITLYEPGARGTSVAPDGRLDGALTRAIELAQTVVAGLIVVTGVLAPFALLGLAVWLAVRFRRRRAAE